MKWWAQILAASSNGRSLSKYVTLGGAKCHWHIPMGLACLRQPELRDSCLPSATKIHWTTIQRNKHNQHIWHLMITYLVADMTSDSDRRWHRQKWIPFTDTMRKVSSLLGVEWAWIASLPVSKSLERVVVPSWNEAARRLRCHPWHVDFARFAGASPFSFEFSCP